MLMLIAIFNLRLTLIRTKVALSVGLQAEIYNA